MLEPKRSAPASYAVAQPQVSKMPQRDLNTPFQLYARSAKTDCFIAGKEAHIQNFNNSERYADDRPAGRSQENSEVRVLSVSVIWKMATRQRSLFSNAYNGRLKPL